MMKIKNFKFKYVVVLKCFGFWLLFCFLGIFLKWIFLEKLAQISFFNGGNPVFSIFEIHNKGAAFNILTGYSNFIIVASILALIGLTFLFSFYSTKISNIGIAGFSFLCAGITLNLFERISLGYVVDYIYVDIIPNIPVFNIADIMIVLGASILIYAMFKYRQG